MTGTEITVDLAAASDIRDPVSVWQSMPYAVLRMAGFPFAWLDDLAQGSAARAAARLAGERQRLDEIASAANRTEMRVAAQSSEDRALLRALRRSRIPAANLVQANVSSGSLQEKVKELIHTLARHKEAEQAFADDYERECMITAEAVLGRYRVQPALRDMLLVSNERSYDVLTQWVDRVGPPGPRWRSADRRMLDKLVLYLQRVCGKNDTTSHFGPFALGRLDDQVHGITWRPTPLRRFPQLSRWAADALAERIGEDPQVWPLVRPRRSPGAVVSGSTLRVVDFDQEARTRDVRRAVHIRSPSRLDAEDSVLLDLCTGDRTLVRITELAGRHLGRGDLSLPEVASRLQDLERRGAVVFGPELSYGIENPLPSLRSFLGDGPAAHRWQAVLDGCTRMVHEFAAGDTAARRRTLNGLKRCFSTAVDLSPTRGHGQFYSDRTVLYEECQGKVGELRVGSPVLDVMRDDLGIVYDLFLLRPRCRLVAERRLLASWFDDKFGGFAQISVDRYLQAFLDDYDRLELNYAQVDAKVAAVSDAVERALLPPTVLDAKVHHVKRDYVEQVIRTYGTALPAVCNPDLMIAADSAEALVRGKFQVVVGDLHAFEEIISHGPFAPFVEQAFLDYAEDVMACYTDLLDEGEQIAQVTQLHRAKMYLRTTLPCLDVEAFGRSPKPRAAVARLGDLIVCRTDSGLSLRVPGAQRFLRLTAPPFVRPHVRRNPFSIFGFPTSDGAPALPCRQHPHLPRLQIGKVIVQRETWRVPIAYLAAKDAREGFLRTQILRTQLRLPRHVYASFPNEPKPLYCDLDSPLLVRQLTRTARATEGEIDLVEMLPRPDQLWLRDSDGTYTTELRYAVFTRPRHGTEPHLGATRMHESRGEGKRRSNTSAANPAADDKNR